MPSCDMYRRVGQAMSSKRAKPIEEEKCTSGQVPTCRLVLRQAIEVTDNEVLTTLSNKKFFNTFKQQAGIHRMMRQVNIGKMPRRLTRHMKSCKLTTLGTEASIWNTNLAKRPA